MCGSSPLAEAVTRSTGTWALLSGSARLQGLHASGDSLAQRRVDRLPNSNRARRGGHCRARDWWPTRRDQKYLGASNGWPISDEKPTTCPSPSTIRLPPAWCGNTHFTQSGSDQQRIGHTGGNRQQHEDTCRAARGVERRTWIESFTFRLVKSVAGQTAARVDQFDADERHQQPTQAINQQVVAQQRRGANRAILHAP